MNKKKQRVAALFSECEAVKKLAEDEKRDLTPEELTLVNTKMDEIDALNLAIKTEERMSKFSPPADEPQPGPKSFQGEVDIEVKPVYRSLGQQLVDIADHALGRADSRAVERLANIRAASGMNTTIPSEGGFLVQTDFSTALLSLAHETGDLTSRMTKIPIGPNSDSLEAPYVNETSRATGSRWGGVRVYRRAEAATVTASKPTLDNWELKLEDLMGVCYVTGRALQDANSLGAVFREAFMEEFPFVINDEAIRGTGVGQMMGVLSSPCLVTVDKQAGQAADTIVYENVKKMRVRMPQRWRANAAWFINAEAEEQLESMYMAVGVGGIPVYMPAGGVSGSQYSTLYGRPVIPLEQCSKLGDLGDIIFADFSQYILITKGGLDVAESMHVKFIYDEMCYRFMLRNNGMPRYKSAITPYKGNNPVSPFVTLAAR
jgi:HK97 family phage major capsid protein